MSFLNYADQLWAGLLGHNTSRSLSVRNSAVSCTKQLIICRTLRKSNKNFDVFNNKNFQKELYLWYVKISLFYIFQACFTLSLFKLCNQIVKSHPPYLRSCSSGNMPARTAAKAVTPAPSTTAFSSSIRRSMARAMKSSLKKKQTNPTLKESFSSFRRIPDKT